MCQDNSSIFFRLAGHRIKNNLRSNRSFVWIVNACEVLDLATSRALIDAFRIALLANFQGRVNEHFNEAISAQHVTDIIARCAIWTDRSADDRSPMPYNLSRDEAHAP